MYSTVTCSLKIDVTISSLNKRVKGVKYRLKLVEGFHQSCYSPVIMSIFLLTAVPLISFFYLSLEFKGLTSTKTFKTTFVSGFALSVLSVLILAIVNYYVQQRYTKLMVFVCHWIFDVLYYTVFSVGGYFILSFRTSRPYRKRKDFPFLYSFFAGYFSPVGLYMLIRNFYTFDSYILFLFPLMLVALGFWLPFIILEAQRQRGYVRVLIFLSILPFTLVIALVPELYYLNYHTYATLLDLFILLLCSSVYSILRDDYVHLFGLRRG